MSHSMLAIMLRYNRPFLGNIHVIKLGVLKGAVGSSQAFQFQPQLSQASSTSTLELASYPLVGCSRVLGEDSKSSGSSSHGARPSPSDLDFAVSLFTENHVAVMSRSFILSILFT